MLLEAGTHTEERARAFLLRVGKGAGGRRGVVDVLGSASAAWKEWTDEQSNLSKICDF